MSSSDQIFEICHEPQLTELYGIPSFQHQSEEQSLIASSVIRYTSSWLKHHMFEWILERKTYKTCTHLQSTASHRYRTCLEQLASIKFSELRCAANFKDLIRAGHNLISMFRLLSFSPPPVMITFSLCNFTLEFFFHNRFSRLNWEYQRGHWPPQFFAMVEARPS